MGFNEFKSQSAGNEFILDIDMRNVVGVGGGGIIFDMKNGMVLKMEKVEIQLAKKWNPQRKGKKLDGTSTFSETELHFEEEMALNAFEFGTIKGMIKTINVQGGDSSMLMDPARCHLLKINNTWFMATGKLLLFYTISR